LLLNALCYDNGVHAIGSKGLFGRLMQYKSLVVAVDPHRRY